MTKIKNKKSIGIVAAFFAVLCLTLIYIPSSALASEPDGDYVRIADTYYTITNTSDLVDADLALLEWHAKGNNDTTGDIIVSASFGGEKINRYDNVYAEVYNRLLNASETTHLVDGDNLFSSGNDENLYIYAVKGMVNYGKRITLGAGQKVLVLAEDNTATIRVYYSSGGKVPRLGLNAEVSDEQPAIAFQGLSDQQDLPITWSGKPRTDNVFELRSGSIYFNYCSISKFQFRSGNSETSSAANRSFLILPNTVNRKRFVYMSNSSMTELVAQEAPGIFCKAYSTNNGYNKQSYLYLYNNTFSDCLSTGSNSSAYGGAVIRSYAADQCHLRVKDCIFENNRSTTTGDASGGGAIYWKSVPGDAVLTGCIFRNNSASLVGGAIYNTGTMDIYGCTFENNYAGNGGGAIAVEPPFTTSSYTSLENVTMSGSLELDSDTIIRNNSTDGNGGAIYFNSYASQIGSDKSEGGFDILNYDMTLNINGAWILNNKAKGNGGAVAMWLNYQDREYSSGITIDGNSVIRGNIAGYVDDETIGDGDGGAIWMSSASDCDCTDELNDGVNMLSGVLAENKAHSGGAVYIKTGNPLMSMDFTVSGGTIGGESNSAVNGGAVYVDGGNVSVSGGTVSNNIASASGGAVFVNVGDVNIENAAVLSNIANENGGAVYMDGGTLNVKDGGSINGNSAKNGGGAYVNGGEVYVAGGSITSNIASNNGGGIAVNNGNYYMVGGNVDSNTAQNGSGGGIYVAADGSNVNVGVYSGSVSSNSAKLNGGALSVVGNHDGIDKVTVQIGVNEKHKNEDGTGVSCDHDYKDIVTPIVTSCPVVTGNHASASGGAVYVTGNNSLTTLNIFCLTELASNPNRADGDVPGLSNFMKVDGGKVTITTTLAENMIEEDGEASVQDDRHGSTSILSTIYVTGGDMELWGEMTNPDINDVITVDITKEGDKFKDYRLNNKATKYYQLLYYENFKNPETGIVTGQYKQYKITHGDIVTINANIYSHPGYEIKGWNTNDYWNDPLIEYYPADTEGKAPLPRPTAEMDQTLGWYEIGLKYLFDEAPIGDLIIYANWVANGYTVVYEPNVPIGETYYGKMEKSEFVYNGTENTLRPNEFFRPGYIFNGWNVEKNPADQSTNIADNANVGNLTDEQGKTVVLYAQWRVCDHTDIDSFTYEIIENSPQDKILRRTCSCQAYNEDVHLKAKNTVYDQSEHKIDVICSSSIWQPEEVYTALDTGDVLSSNNLPYHAGNYRATVTVTDGEGTVWTVSVDFEIAKADQNPPVKPLYEAKTEGDDTYVYIEPVQPSPITDAYYKSVPEYRVVYYVDGNLQEVTDWVQSDGLIDDKYAVKIKLNKSLINYYIEARYSECDNYNASPKVVADKVLFFSGGVTFYLVSGEGLITEEIIADGTDAKVNEITVTVMADSGYYFPKGYTASLITEGAEGNAQATLQTTLGLGVDGKPYYEYIVKDIPQNCKITMILPDAIPNVKIESYIAEKQKFEMIDTISANISADSAYTVYYRISNYNITEYQIPVLNFTDALGAPQILPEGTTVIMQDMYGNSVDYYRVNASGKSSISLDEFFRMGTAGDSFAERDGEMKLQFIVDFSRVTGSLLANGNYTTTMTCAKKDGSFASDVAAGVTVNVTAVPAYSLENVTGDVTENKGVKFVRTYSDGAASKWDGRAEALVLTPVNSALIPEDAYLSILCNRQTTEIYSNGKGQFVYYLPSGDTGVIEVTLKSNLLAGTGGNFDFTIDWMISNSESETSPMNGDRVASIETTVACEAQTHISLKLSIDGNEDRLFELGDTINVIVAWRDLPHATHSLKVTVMKKTRAEYINTGISKDIVFDSDNGEKEVEIPLAGITEGGSFKLLVKSANGVSTVAQAEYYFIIK